MEITRRSATAITVAFFALAACGGESQRSRPTDVGVGAGSSAAGGGVGGKTSGSPSVGGSEPGSSGAGGQPPGGMSSTGGATAGADADGGAMPGGNAGEGGSGDAGAPSCPRIECASPCPTGRWLGPDDCATCACAPPPTQLIHDAVPCPSDKLSLTAMSSYFIGAIDRWVLDFEWTCSEVTVGRPQRGELQVRLEMPQVPPIDADSRTFYLGSGNDPYFISGAMVALAGSGVPEIEISLQPTNSFLSIRREGDELVGGIYYVGEDASQGNDSTLAGPFRVPVPTI